MSEYFDLSSLVYSLVEEVVVIGRQTSDSSLVYPGFLDQGDVDVLLAEKDLQVIRGALRVLKINLKSLHRPGSVVVVVL